MWIRKEKLDKIELRLAFLEGAISEAKKELEEAKNQIVVLSQRKEPQKKEEKPDIIGSFPNFKPKHMFCPNEDYKGGN